MGSSTTDRRLGLVGDKGMKAPVDLATTGNITLSGEQTIDGVATSGSRVLVWQQSDPTTNGIYDTNTAAWTRSLDADGNLDLVKGTMFAVTGGGQAGEFFQVASSNPVYPGTSAITFQQVITNTAAGLQAMLANYVSNILGAAMLGYGPTLTYPSNSIGLAVALATNNVINVESAPYGATGAGYPTDDSAAIQAAITAGVSQGRPVYLPRTYYCASQITWTGQLKMFGANPYMSGIVSGYTGAGGALQGNISSFVLFNHLEGFSISAHTAGQGVSGTNPAVCTSALRVVLTGVNGSVADSTMERLYLGSTYIPTSSLANGDFAGWGLVLDNSINNQDGFYTSSIKRCYIQNGVNGVYIGDSMNLEHLSITDGPSRKIAGSGGMVGVQITTAAGAACATLSDCNITTSGGSLAATGVNQLRVNDCQMEFPGYASGTVGGVNYLYMPYSLSAFASNGAMVYLNNVKYLSGEGNNINPAADNFVGYVSAAFTCTSSTNVIDLYYLATTIFPGCTVSGPGIPAGARVKAVGTWSGGTYTQLTLTANVFQTIASSPTQVLYISNPNAGLTAPGNNIFTITGTTHGNTTVDTLSSTTGLQNGMTVTGDGIAPGTTFTISGGALTLSAAATTSASGVTLSIGVSPNYAINVIDGSGASLNNLFESSSVFAGNLGHMHLSCAAGNPAVQFGAGMNFMGAVQNFAGNSSLVPVSFFPYLSGNSGNVSYQNSGPGHTYTPVFSGPSGLSAVSTGATAIYQVSGNTVHVSGSFVATWPGANQTFAVEASLPITPMCAGTALQIAGVASGNSGIGGGVQTNIPDWAAYITGTGAGSSGTYSLSYSYDYQLST